MKMTVIVNESEGSGRLPSVPCCNPQWKQNFRLLGSLFLAVAEVQNRLVESIVEGKMKPASSLPSDGRADGRVLRADASACHPDLHQHHSLPHHLVVVGKSCLHTVQGVFWLKIHTKTHAILVIKHHDTYIPASWSKSLSLSQRYQGNCIVRKNSTSGLGGQRPKINCVHCPL